MRIFFKNRITETTLNRNYPLPSKHTRIITTLLWFAPLFIMAIIIGACSKLTPGHFVGNISEGIIEYKISFPELNGESITATLLPDKMTFYFKDNSFSTSFEAAGGVFKNKIIANKQQRKVDHHLKVLRKKIRVSMDETEVLQMLADYPKMTVIETGDTDTIAGYPCKKALLVFEDIDKKHMEVYYTKSINMENPNWCNQYHEINGVLMAYEIVEFGVKMRLEAVSVKNEKVNSKLFLPQEDFVPISKTSMDIELAQLVETFEL